MNFYLFLFLLITFVEKKFNNLKNLFKIFNYQKINKSKEKMKNNYF